MRYLLKEGLKNIWNNRLMSIASIGVLFFSLILIGGAILFSLNISSALKAVEQQNSVTVYLDSEISELESVQIGNKIKNLDNIESCEFYSKEAAIERYEEVLGELFEGMQGDDNPLPNAFHVSMTDLSKYDQTVKSIQNIDGVDTVSDRRESAEKLTTLNKLVTITGFWVVLILGLVSLFIISNTIRITMYSRRLEISIMKSVGATDGFIRIPFLVEGISIGLISSVLAASFLSLLYELIIKAVHQIVPFTAIPFTDVAFAIIIIFIAIGLFFGTVGGFISIRKYLKKGGGDIIGI